MKTTTLSRLAFAALLSLLAIGCTTVTFKQPVGTPSADAAAKLRGTWLLNEDGVVFINGGADGKLVLAGVDDDGDNDVKLTKAKAVVTVLDDKAGTFFLNLENEEKKDGPKPPGYTVVLMKAEDKRLLAWPIKDEAIKAAIEKKELPGSIQGDGRDIRVDAGKEALDAYFKAQGQAAFKMDEPLVVRRIGEEKKNSGPK